MSRSPAKLWRRDEYRDKLTGDLVAIEVVPEGDLRPHTSDEGCDCLPSLKSQRGALMLVHNAFDGREFEEAHNREKGN